MPPDSHNWDKEQIARGALFLQSEPWGEFQAAIGHQPHYLQEKNWSCLLVERRAGFAKYLLAAYGPTLDNYSSAAGAFEAIRAHASTGGFDWVRLEPLVDGAGGPQMHQALQAAGAGRAPHDLNPQFTRIIDIGPDAEEILGGISQTTRNLIHRNQEQKIIDFKTSSEPADISIFTNMVSSVARRNRVNFYPAEYYLEQAKVLMPLKRMYLELAYDNGLPVGGLIIHDFGETACYTHAASLPSARDKNVSALLLWQAVLNAKQRGIEHLDLFGVAPEDAPPNHPWAGFSAFKKKFGGIVVERSGTWDIPISAKYRAYRTAYRAKNLLGR